MKINKYFKDKVKDDKPQFKTISVGGRKVKVKPSKQPKITKIGLSKYIN